MVVTIKDLRGVFFDHYGGFADNRYRNLKLDKPFSIDDREPSDFDAQGNLFPWFCQMFVNIEAVDIIKVTLRGDVPRGKEVDLWFEQNGANQNQSGIEFFISPSNFETLNELEEAFMSIITRKYRVASYKYVVPRTAASIQQLHKLVKSVWC